MTSAEKPLGMDSHPFTTASPRAQIFFSAFSLTSLSDGVRSYIPTFAAVRCRNVRPDPG
jgi:hypothetical protein